MDALRLSVEADPGPAGVQVVRQGLVAWNLAHSTIGDTRDLFVCLRDEAGRIVGGACCATWGDWLEIHYLWIEPALHGMGWGSRVLDAAEREAIDRGCAMAQLDTYSFQAPGFYVKHGYEVFAALEGFPGGQRRFYMRKRLR